LPLLAQEISAQKTMGANDQQLAGIAQQLGDLRAIRERIETASSPMVLAQLRTQAANAIRVASESVQSAQGSAAAVSGAAALRAASPEARRLLGQGSAEISARTGEMFSIGSKYGIDLSDERVRERELKRKEEDLRNKGDLHGALGAHSERLHNEIGGYDKLLESGKLSPEEQRKIEARKQKAQEELEKT